MAKVSAGATDTAPIIHTETEQFSVTTCYRCQETEKRTGAHFDSPPGWNRLEMRAHGLNQPPELSVQLCPKCAKEVAANITRRLKQAGDEGAGTRAAVRPSRRKLGQVLPEAEGPPQPGPLPQALGAD